MVELLDGPCKGTYLVKRAPVYLRAVLDGKGEGDLLDQVEDTPKKQEAVYVYKREGSAGWVHLNSAKAKGYYAIATYRFMPEAVGESLRDNAVWQAWATEQLAKEV